MQIIEATLNNLLKEPERPKARLPIIEKLKDSKSVIVLPPLPLPEVVWANITDNIDNVHRVEAESICIYSATNSSDTRTFIALHGAFIEFRNMHILEIVKIPFFGGYVDCKVTLLNGDNLWGRVNTGDYPRISARSSFIELDISLRSLRIIEFLR